MNLAKSGEMEIHGLSSAIPTDTARYHLFWYKHTHEGDYTESAGQTFLNFFIKCVAKGITEIH